MCVPLWEKKFQMKYFTVIFSGGDFKGHVLLLILHDCIALLSRPLVKSSMQWFLDSVDKERPALNMLLILDPLPQIFSELVHFLGWVSYGIIIYCLSSNPV